MLHLPLCYTRVLPPSHSYLILRCIFPSVTFTGFWLPGVSCRTLGTRPFLTNAPMPRCYRELSPATCALARPLQLFETMKLAEPGIYCDHYSPDVFPPNGTVLRTPIGFIGGTRYTMVGIYRTSIDPPDMKGQCVDQSCDEQRTTLTICTDLMTSPCLGLTVSYLVCAARNTGGGRRRTRLIICYNVS